MSERFARYKGKTYKLLYKGKTAHGERAKLAFMDGSKEFWVDAALVVETAPARSESREPRCRCTRPIDEGDGECMVCGYMMYGED
jgi:hypothetical protein